MPKINPEDSSFPIAKTLDIQSSMGEKLGWRNYISEKFVDYAKNLAQASVSVAIITAVTVAGGQSNPKIDAEILESQKMHILNDVYLDQMERPGGSDRWKSIDKNMDIVHINSGQKIEDTRFAFIDLSQFVNSKDSESGNKKGLLTTQFIEIKALANSSAKDNSASSTSYSKQHLGAENDNKGSVCIINTNLYISKHHQELQEKIKVSDSVVAEFILARESANCVTSARRIEAAERIVNGKDVGRDIPFTPQAHEAASKARPTLAELDPDDKFGKENLKRNSIDFTQKNIYTQKSGHEANEYADVMAALSLIKQDKFDVSNIKDLADYRREQRGNSKNNNHDADTSSFLLAVYNNLKNNPDVVTNWQNNNHKELQSPQMKDVDKWVMSALSAHSQAKDYEAHKKNPAQNVHVEGFSNIEFKPGKLENKFGLWSQLKEDPPVILAEKKSASLN